ncbi:methyltransferase-like protein 27 [Haliotis rufescens]|uniref:methyltransferase-like protein 27 n=1 Tax=Haliotis rufescens TaxID=6454 RepID=UPI00201F2848|nr:methyltransferase-like protein 27 [Haliotis rufescens]XP_046373207.2 methyltransferase-like protein 27 [Haliotis rufescens]
MAGTTYTNVKEGNTFLDHITEKGLDNKSIINRFDKVSGEYNEALRSVDFMGPRSLAGILAELHPSDRENVRVLDLAAGTGLVAIELKKKGFVSTDGLEPSEGMLAEAKRNNLYGRYICDMVGENTFDIETDTYSAITMSALSLEIFKKLPVKALEEMARVVKPGGHILMTQYDFAFDSEVLKASLSNLEDRGVWKLIEMRPVPDFTKGKDGLVSVHQVLK